jgi:hypothetical protein
VTAGARHSRQADERDAGGHLAIALGSATPGGDLRVLARHARRPVPVGTGLARLQTDEYVSWPEAGTQIPRRFFEAHNEVLLTSAEDFPREFDAHAAATDDEQIVERLSTRRPGMFPRDPHDPSAPPSPQQAGQYRIRVRPAEVLDRARAWIRRPNEPFDLFISQSLRDYVTGTEAGEAEYGKRTQQVSREPATGALGNRHSPP